MFCYRMFGCHAFYCTTFFFFRYTLFIVLYPIGVTVSGLPKSSHFNVISRVPVEGKSSVCVICMKYMIIMFIIIVISLGQILLSYIANAHAQKKRGRSAGCRWRPTVTQLMPLFVAGRSFVQINNCVGDTVSASFLRI